MLILSPVKKFQKKLEGGQVLYTILKDESDNKILLFYINNFIVIIFLQLIQRVQNQHKILCFDDFCGWFLIKGHMSNYFTNINKTAKKTKTTFEYFDLISGDRFFLRYERQGRAKLHHRFPYKTKLNTLSYTSNSACSTVKEEDKKGFGSLV